MANAIVVRYENDGNNASNITALAPGLVWTMKHTFRVRDEYVQSDLARPSVDDDSVHLD